MMKHGFLRINVWEKGFLSQFFFSKKGCPWRIVGELLGIARSTACKAAYEVILNVSSILCKRASAVVVW